MKAWVVGIFGGLIAIVNLNGASAQTITIASDSADNSAYSTYGAFDGVNGGTGFGTWSVTASSTGGSYVNPSSFDTTGVLTSRVFDIFDNGNGSLNSGITTANRQFANPLTAGQTFSFQDVLHYSNGLDGNGNATSLLGFNLQSSTGANLLTFDVGGGGAGYMLSDATRNNELETSVPYNYQQAYTFAVTFNDAAGNYTLTVTGGSLPAQGESFSGLMNITAGAPDAFAVFNNDGGYSSDVQFSTLQITSAPEPGSLILISAGASLFMLRRRRAVLANA